MSDSGKLYDLLWDAIEGFGEYSYFEVIGVLELIKTDLINELNEISNQAESEE